MSINISAFEKSPCYNRVNWLTLFLILEGKRKANPHFLKADPRATSIFETEEDEMLKSESVDLDELETFGREDVAYNSNGKSFRRSLKNSSKSEEEEIPQVDGASDKKGRGRKRRQRGNPYKSTVTRTLRSGSVRQQNKTIADESADLGCNKGQVERDAQSVALESQDLESLSDPENSTGGKLLANEKNIKQASKLSNEQGTPQVQRAVERSLVKSTELKEFTKTQPTCSVVNTDTSSTILEERKSLSIGKHVTVVPTEDLEVDDDSQSDLDALVIDYELLSPKRKKAEDSLEPSILSPEKGMSTANIPPKIIPLESASEHDSNANQPVVILVCRESLVLSSHFLCSSLLIGSSKTDHKLLSHLAIGSSNKDQFYIMNDYLEI